MDDLTFFNLPVSQQSYSWRLSCGSSWVRMSAEDFRKAVLEAAESIGNGGQEQDALAGYLHFLATTHYDVFAELVRQVMAPERQCE